MLGELVLCALNLVLCTLYAKTKAHKDLNDLKTTNKALSSKLIAV